MLVLYSHNLIQGKGSITSFEDLTNFRPKENLTPTITADSLKDGKNKEASKLLHLINIITDAGREEREGRMAKSIDLFSLLPEHENTIEEDGKTQRKLPDQMLRFFLPADRIIPRQYGKRGNHINGGREDPYAPMYDIDASDESDGDKEDTTSYESDESAAGGVLGPL